MNTPLKTVTRTLQIFASVSGYLQVALIKFSYSAFQEMACHRYAPGQPPGTEVSMSGRRPFREVKLQWLRLLSCDASINDTVARFAGSKRPVQLAERLTASCT